MASTFCVSPHSLTTKGGARFEVGWAPHIHRCPGRCFGRFPGGWRCCCNFWRPFAFVFASVGCQRIGGGHWVLTALGGVSRLFSFLDLGWCEGMVDDGGGDEERSV